MTEPELNTCPSFLYEQLDEGEMTIERPIQVVYWNGNIELRQDGRYVLILNDDIKPLFKFIMKHFPEAQKEITK